MIRFGDFAQLGDLQSNSFESQWQGVDYKNFRSTLMQSRSKIEICKNGTEGKKIWG
jgi:hypothetical protein